MGRVVSRENSLRSNGTNRTDGPDGTDSSYWSHSSYRSHKNCNVPGIVALAMTLLPAMTLFGAAPAAPPVGRTGHLPQTTPEHWSFLCPVRPPLPAVTHESSAGNAVDRFILSRLERENIPPSPQAHRATLIRRLSLDLLGLPPTPEEVDRFTDDTRPDAYERLVDRLLASPAYGERWARHWLDGARYADSNGYTRDFSRDIWKYREWVIEAINRNLAFDQFSIEQIAGDMLPDRTADQIVATGFHRNTLINEEGGTDQEQFRVEAVADRVATTGAVFLGLTLDCARCHDHKYDPITQREYYQIFAFFNNCDEPTIEVPYDWQVTEGVIDRRDAIRKQIGQLEEQLRGQQTELDKAQTAWEATITPAERAALAGPTQEALAIPLAQRNDEQKRLVAAVFRKTDVARRDFPLLQEIASLRDKEPAIPTTMVLDERTVARTTHIHRRGNFLDLGAAVDPGVPGVLPSLSAEGQVPTRLDFARWLVDAGNPLTARVIVNRCWQQYFGRAIVETENDFGAQGIRPTHPELLDWLAVEFVAQGWSVKALHRTMVTSATYRQASRYRQELDEVDPDNKLLARQSRLRLEAEIVRDVALAASGLLTRTIGGPSVYPPQPDGVFEFTQDLKPWNTELGANRFRRGMYTFFWRSSPFPALVLFDAPDSNVTCTRRLRSNTPLQALTLANDVQFLQCAGALARDVLDQFPSDDEKRVGHAFRRCLARNPSSQEQDRLLALLDDERRQFAADTNAARDLVGATGLSVGDRPELAAWTTLCRVIMNLDEFITRE